MPINFILTSAKIKATIIFVVLCLQSNQEILSSYLMAFILKNSLLVTLVVVAFLYMTFVPILGMKHSFLFHCLYLFNLKHTNVTMIKYLMVCMCVQLFNRHALGNALPSRRVAYNFAKVFISQPVRVHLKVHLSVAVIINWLMFL